MKYNGIDRVDNSRGYESGNVVSCCGVCNMLKHVLSKEEFLARIEKIYKNSIQKDPEEYRDDVFFMENEDGEVVPAYKHTTCSPIEPE